ncbi:MULTISPECIES: FeoB-associated Cys-rich membrane protein [Eubacterium]|uniref:FeoB-associated Cys-rich membrane protein n=1 Tax=Eubacterium TaxID=1730 RepID=UPI001567CEBF|nr:FeoB-associated Cys-rich membrane protein [Eubacterium sp.]
MGSFIASFIVLILIAGACFLSIRKMVRNKKSGKSLSCGCDCGNCGMPCHLDSKDKDKIAKK